MNYDVTVIIVTYNTGKLMNDCLQSLLGQAGSLKQQILVVDNGSEDDTVSVLTGYDDIEVTEAGENLGFARAVNYAARKATGEFVVLLNPDTVVLDRAIERLVMFARQHPGHGLYGGRAIKRNGDLERSSCWGLPTLWSMFCFATGLTTIFRESRVFDPESLGRWRRDTAREVGLVTGCLLLVPRSVWDELRGFDESFFMYGEDADLAFRARALGYRPIITPSACIVHDVGGASATRRDKMMLLFKGKATLFLRTVSGRRGSILRFELQLGVALRALISRIRGASPADGWQYLWSRRAEWRDGYR